MKNKWIIILVLACCIALCFHKCKSICTTTDEIRHYIATQKGIEHIDGLTIVEIIDSHDKAKALVICELGDPYASRIFAWEFNMIAHKIFVPDSGYVQNDEPCPIKTFIWDSKSIVVINDDSVKAVGVVLGGAEKIEKIESYPTILKLSLATIGNLVYYDENMLAIN